MLRLTSLITILISAQLSLPSIAVAAEKLDIETNSLVVEKLRSVLTNDLKDVARAPIQLRLADVLSERARLKALKEVELSCDNCQQSREDRAEALKLYESAFANENSGPAVDKGAVLLQMAHLNELLVQPDKAAKLYEQAIGSPKGKYSQHTIAASYASLADYKFTKGEFTKAKDLYDKALKLSPPGTRGSITYRLAWCKLNMGETAQATSLIEKVLSSPDLLTHETQEGPKFDASFQEDVSRDYASFLAHGSVGAKEIEKLEKLSPESARKTNVEYLATETDRLGNRQASLLAWEAYLKLEPSRDERLESYARISRLYVESGNREQAVTSLGGLAKEFTAQPCKTQICTTVLEQTRKLIGDWAKLEKKNPSALLLSGYEAYLKMKSDDLEMIFWAANLARTQKQHESAIKFYQNAATLAKSQLASAKTDKEKETTKSIFEASLLSEIEIAEASKNTAQKISAYNNYLSLNPNGAKAWEVKYQLAYIDFEAGRVAQAIEAFHTLSLVKPCLNALCSKAADLSLDGLVQVKDETKIESYATEYAKAYPSQANSYLKIARTSATNQVIRLSKTLSLSQAEAEHGLAKLQAIPMAGASENDVVANLKLQILLAEKANDLNQVVTAANKLAALRGVSSADRVYAVGKLAWAFEMSFEFQKAYQIVRHLDVPRSEQANHALKLAVLADLAGENPSKHEDEYLKLAPHGSDASLLRAKKIRRASNPKAEFQKQSVYLSAELAGQLALEIYAKTADTRFAEKTLLSSKLRNTEAAQTFAGLELANQITEVKKQISRQALRAYNDSVLAKSLQQRIELLHKLDKLAVEANRRHDWSSQVLAVAGLAQENQRLYNEIMNLPIPRKLKPQQRAQYQAAVAAKATPFARNAEQLNEKAEQLWAQTESLNAITQGFTETPAQYRRPLVARLKALETQAPSSQKSKLAQALANKADQISGSELAQARKEAQKQPFNASAVSHLKDLEAKAGRETMVAYLDGRLSMLKQSGRM